MTAPIQSFSFDDLPVRVLERSGAPWFVGNDVCGVLSISDARQAIDRLDDDERGVCTVPTPGGPQEMRCISESGLWALVLTSRKLAAKRFRKWVTAEVLPAIRRTGRYEASGQPRKWSGTSGPFASDPDMNGTAGALALVQTCERLWGRAEARALWAQLGLPVPEVPARPGRAAPGRAPVPASAWETRAHDGRIAAAFLAACTRPDPDGSVASSVLFQAFGRWSRGQDIGRWDTRRFAAALTGLGYRKYKKDVVLWLGFTLAGPAA